MASKPLPLSFSTLGTSELNWADTLSLAASAGFHGVEIRCLDGKTIAPESFSELLPAPTELSEQLNHHQVSVPMLGTSAKLLDRTAGELEDLAGFAKLADAIDCPWLRIFDGGPKGGAPTEQQLEESSKFLDQWNALRKAEGFKAQIAVETHDALVTCATTRSVMAALPHFDILWDTHHTWRTGNESLTEYYQLVKERTVHFHLKDSIDRPSARKPFTYIEPGLGEFPWDELRGLLESNAPDGYLSFEWERHWNPELPAMAEVMKGYLKIVGNWEKNSQN